MIIYHKWIKNKPDFFTNRYNAFFHGSLYTRDSATFLVENEIFYTAASHSDLTEVIKFQFFIYLIKYFLKFIFKNTK